MQSFFSLSLFSLSLFLPNSHLALPVLLRVQEIIGLGAEAEFRARGRGRRGCRRHRWIQERLDRQNQKIDAAPLVCSRSLCSFLDSPRWKGICFVRASERRGSRNSERTRERTRKAMGNERKSLVSNSSREKVRGSVFLSTSREKMHSSLLHAPLPERRRRQPRRRGQSPHARGRRDHV